METRLGLLDISNLLHIGIYSYMKNEILTTHLKILARNNNINDIEIDNGNIIDILSRVYGHNKLEGELNKLHYKAFELSYSETIKMLAYSLRKRIYKLIDELKLTHIIIAWDEENGKNFRRIYDVNYKANRKSKSKVFKDFKNKVYDVLKNNFNIISNNHCEADDIINTCVDELKNKFDKTIIISADKDLLCLLEDYKVLVYRLKYDINILYETSKDVLKDTGVHPKDFMLYLSLTGDGADNISGIKGVGDKYAKKIIEYYKDLTVLRDDIIFNDIKVDLPINIKEKIYSGLKDFLKSSCLVELKKVPFKNGELDNINKFRINKK